MSARKPEIITAGPYKNFDQAVAMTDVAVQAAGAGAPAPEATPPTPTRPEGRQPQNLLKGDRQSVLS